MKTMLLRKFSLLGVFVLGLLSILATAIGDGESGSISIRSPDAGATVSGVITVEGRCSLIDQLTVVIDNDAFSRQVVDCNLGRWEADFDTTRFQDGDHALVAYASDTVRDQIQITTSNGNASGYTVTVPVSLADGIYDEIDDYTPLFVYAKRVSTGLVTGQRFTVGTFPGEYEIPNVLNGVYQIGAFLDRNNNLVPDTGWDFEGTAGTQLEVSNGDATSENVELTLFDGDFDHDGVPDAGGGNPADVYGQLSISQPLDGTVVSGTLEVVGSLSASNADWVTVSIDGNRFTRQVVDVSGVGTGWRTSFDTTRLQDGEHVIRASISDEIWDQVIITTDNGNLQGYSVSVNVDLASGIYDEINVNTPLFVYVQDPGTGARQMARFTSGTFPGSFDIDNVPNNTYIVGAFLDRNNNGVEDSGDYAGQAADLLTVWYADATADVVLVGNEVHITTPAPLTEIRANYIDMAGTYTFQPDKIVVLMRITGVTYETVEADATFNNGEWSAQLDITDVTQEGERQLHVKARYGATWKWDTVRVYIDRSFPRGIDITQPADGASISKGSALSVAGGYYGVPQSISVSLEDGNGGSVDATASFINGSWTAQLADLSSVQPGLRTLTVTADYDGGIIETAQINVTITDIAPIREVVITAPLDGETVTTDNLVVQGTYEGSPTSITVTLETDGVGGKLTETVNAPSGGAWSVEFADISGVINGQRVLMAVADYGGGETAVDTVTLTVDRPPAAVALSVIPDMPAAGEGGGAYFNINASNELSLDVMLSPSSNPGPDTALVMSLLPSDTQADFDAGPDWTMTSRSHANPVDETVQASYIVRRNSSGDYYKLVVGFDIWSGAGLGGAMQFAVTSLSGWNCGAKASNCP